MNKNIKRNYNQELDVEFKRKYKFYVGVDADDKTNHYFNRQQQIERYAINIAFWKKRTS